jgi:hypothetical protein
MSSINEQKNGENAYHYILLNNVSTLLHDEVS